MQKKDTPFDALRKEKKKKQGNIFTSGGEQIHRMIQAEYAMSGRLGAAEAVLVDKSNLLVSKVDVTLKDGTPVEVKSIGADELRSMSHPHFEHVAQLSYYIKSQGLTRGYLQYVARENTGFRKVFEIDVNGLYKSVGDVSTEYMQIRREGVSDSKFQFAFDEGVKSFRSNDYYVENFKKISEESKQFSAQMREIQRKKDWLQTYRTLTSGLYEKNSLAVSGMQRNFDSNSEWGSPTSRKLDWKKHKSPKQIEQAGAKFRKEREYRYQNPYAEVNTKSEEEFIERLTLRPTEYLDRLEKSPTFDKRRKELVRKELESRRGSYFGSFHDLPPEIERNGSSQTIDFEKKLHKYSGEDLARLVDDDDFNERAKILAKQEQARRLKNQERVDNLKKDPRVQAGFEEMKKKNALADQEKDIAAAKAKKERERLHKEEQANLKKAQGLESAQKKNVIKQKLAEFRGTLHKTPGSPEHLKSLAEQLFTQQDEEVKALITKYGIIEEIVDIRAQDIKAKEAAKKLPMLGKEERRAVLKEREVLAEPQKPKPQKPDPKARLVSAIERDLESLTPKETQKLLGDQEEFFKRYHNQSFVEKIGVSEDEIKGILAKKDPTLLIDVEKRLATPTPAQMKELEKSRLRSASRMRYFEDGKVRYFDQSNLDRSVFPKLLEEAGVVESGQGMQRASELLEIRKQKYELRKSFYKSTAGFDEIKNQIPDDLFKYSYIGEELSPDRIAAEKDKYTKAILQKRDEVVARGQDKEQTIRKTRRRKRPIIEERPLKPTERSSNIPVQKTRQSLPARSMTFFDIETSYHRPTSTPFIFEFAGAHLDKETVSEISDLQKLEQIYRGDKAKITKSALHLEASILNGESLSRISKASNLDELIKEGFLGKESLEFYGGKVKEQRKLGRDIDILGVLKEDVEDITRTTHYATEDGFKVSQKYSGFKQVETVEDLIKSQKQMIEGIDEYFGRAEVKNSALAGHNISGFDVNRIQSQAENLRANIKHIRGLRLQDRVDTLTSGFAENFFGRVREVSRDLSEEAFASFFSKQETLDGGRKKTIAALEHLSRAAGFVSEKAHLAGAHRATYDVVQQNIPVFSFMQNFLEASEEEQKVLANKMLENYRSSGGVPHPRLLDDVTSTIEKTVASPQVTARIPRPEPTIVSNFFDDLAAEAKPIVQKTKHFAKNVEEVADFLLKGKGEQVHTTFMRRPGLAMLGLGVGAAVIGGVALSGLLGNHRTTPIRPTTKPLVHEDAAVFPDQESPQRIAARMPTDFGSGYQGLQKVLSAPGVKTPPIKNLTGKVNQLPGQLLDDSASAMSIQKTSQTRMPSASTGVNMSTEVELLANYEKAYVTNKTEQMSRTKRWQILNSGGTRSVFESHKNQIGHHRM